MTRNMRLLTKLEIDRIGRLRQSGIDIALFQPTATGLRKSILDATENIRILWKESEYHDYSFQRVGQDSKVSKKAYVVDAKGTVSLRDISLYRPSTKKGDPRFWVSRLSTHASPNDIVAICVVGSECWILNVTISDVDRILKLDYGFAAAILRPKTEKHLIVSDLTGILQEISLKGYIPADGIGDTMVGRVLEKEIGIAPNSSKAPDYFGIEIKARRERANAKYRHTLFAKTPNWSISEVKSSRDLLDRLGFGEFDNRRLYCTVKSSSPNSHGLYLKVLAGEGLLQEFCAQEENPEVVSWVLKDLHQTLIAKHAETFWVTAKTRIVSGREYFHYTQVEHTASPVVEQFDRLVDEGLIQIDHLIKRYGRSVREKGPLFKLVRTGFPLLFPSSRVFDLAIE